MLQLVMGFLWMSMAQARVFDFSEMVFRSSLQGRGQSPISQSLTSPSPGPAIAMLDLGFQSSRVSLSAGGFSVANAQVNPPTEVLTTGAFLRTELYFARNPTHRGFFFFEGGQGLHAARTPFASSGVGYEFEALELIALGVEGGLHWIDPRRFQDISAVFLGLSLRFYQ